MADEWSLLARALKCSVFRSWSLVEFITVPTTSFVDDLGPLRSAQAIFVWKIGFDATCVLEYDLEIDERVEIVYAGFQTFCDFVTVDT